MRLSLAGVMLFICFLVTGCDLKHEENQDIAITHFDDSEQNRKLVEELILYDPHYLIHKIPALDAATSRGVRVAYFVGSPNWQPSYRITYDLTVDGVAENLDDLKSQFEAFIPILAEQHASREALFLELEPVGLTWTRAFFSEDPTTLLEQSSQLLRDYVTVAQLSTMQSDTVTLLGSPTSFEFIRGQFYEEHGDVPESVSLYYEIEMSGGGAVMFLVTLQQLESEWRAIGFRFNQIR